MRHALALLMLVACSAAPAFAPRDCTPGATVACACPGASGVQTCSAEGMLGACVCADGGVVVADAGPGAADAALVPDSGAVAPDAPAPQDRPQGVDVAMVDGLDVSNVSDVPRDSGDAGPVTVCGPSQVLCAGRCTDTSSDDANCGACGQSCTGQQATFRCVVGACAVARCESGWLDCDRLAANGCEVDGQSARSNCGACGVTCGASERCQLGACVGCGSCPANSQCAAGMCVLCREGTTLCGNSCIDTQTDRNHCGGCGVRCPSPVNATVGCVNGLCAVTACANASEGAVDCDRLADNGCEANLNLNGSCGACGRACGAGTVCRVGGICGCSNSSERLCDGRCASPNDPAHCGACGRMCADNEFCGLVNGTGGAMPGCITCGAEQPGQRLRRCENRCVDLSSDSNNCGECGLRCTGTRACFSGVCR